MGGRGSSSGISEKGNPYGSQYETIFQSGNIKFVKARPGAEEPLLETMTRGRVYVLVTDKGLKNITYFSNELKRNKRIDLDHWHKKMRPHVQHGYFDNEYDKFYHTPFSDHCKSYRGVVAFDLRDALIDSLPKIAIGDLSDIMEGRVGLPYSLGAGHGVDYFRYPDGTPNNTNLAGDAFAEMFSAEIANDQSLEIIK